MRSNRLTVADRQVIDRIVIERLLSGEEASWSELKLPGACRRRVYLRAAQIDEAVQELNGVINSRLEQIQ